MENDRCPDCGHELEFYTYTEDRGECQGIPVKEIMHEGYCPNCAYGDDE